MCTLYNLDLLLIFLETLNKIQKKSYQSRPHHQLQTFGLREQNSLSGSCCRSKNTNAVVYLLPENGEKNDTKLDRKFWYSTAADRILFCKVPFILLGKWKSQSQMIHILVKLLQPFSYQLLQPAPSSLSIEIRDQRVIFSQRYYIGAPQRDFS